MIIRTDDLKNICSTILPAVDSNIISQVSETLSLKTVDKELRLAVTNKTYYVQAKLPLTVEENFEATVNAELFLKLVSSTTTETIEFNITDGTILTMKCNGTYKLPLIFENDHLLELPEITLENVLAEFDVKGDILNSVLTYNTKQLSMGIPSHPVQKLYYVDEKGALTFTQSACINTFTLPSPVKMLLSQKEVKLFKLFKGSTVHFKYAEDEVAPGVVNSKASFETKDVKITTILSNTTEMFNILNSTVDIIRGRATKDYPYTVSINKKLLEDAVLRMKLITDTMQGATSDIKITADKKMLTLSDTMEVNHEELMVTEMTGLTDAHSFAIDINELLGVLSTCSDTNVKIKFGDQEAVAICRESVINVLPVVEE